MCRDQSGGIRSGNSHRGARRRRPNQHGRTTTTGARRRRRTSWRDRREENAAGTETEVSRDHVETTNTEDDEGSDDESSLGSANELLLREITAAIAQREVIPRSFYLSANLSHDSLSSLVLENIDSDITLQQGRPLQSIETVPISMPNTADSSIREQILRFSSQISSARDIENVPDEGYSMRQGHVDDLPGAPPSGTTPMDSSVAQARARFLRRFSSSSMLLLPEEQVAVEEDFVVIEDSRER